MTRVLRFVTCDVFTDVAFAGNQLAVVFGAEGLSDDTLLAVAREFNYSETTFVSAPEREDTTRRVRIFTPGGEVPFAGHPTLGTAHVLVATGEVPMPADATETTLVLGENVGPVPVRVRLAGGAPVEAELTTAQPPEERTDGVPSPADLARVLSLAPSDVPGGDGGSHAPMGVSCGLPFLVVPLASVDAVRRARIDAAAWEAQLRGTWASEPIVFALVRPDVADDRAGLPPTLADVDIRARVFVPGLSVPEDPATGSANACLAAYLAARTPRDGTLRWRVAQGVEMGRPSRLSLSVEKRGGLIDAVRVAGASVVVSEGTLRIPAGA